MKKVKRCQRYVWQRFTFLFANNMILFNPHKVTLERIRTKKRDSFKVSWYYRIIFSVVWKLSGKRGSNPWPLAWEASALPTELLPHTLKIPLLKKEKRADTRTRTGDPRITNALLYQLSHIGKPSFLKCDAKVLIFFEIRKLLQVFLRRKMYKMIS